MNPWVLAYDGFDPPDEGLREALCTLGNGYFATRGAAPEAAADAVHYPGTYVAGCYNRLVSRVAGCEVENEDLVNVPNWLPLTIRPQGGRWLDLEPRRCSPTGRSWTCAGACSPAACGSATRTAG
jgi:trehalose/maltose hydrolase-like predicted phosphorylase